MNGGDKYIFCSHCITEVERRGCGVYFRQVDRNDRRRVCVGNAKVVGHSCS